MLARLKKMRELGVLGINRRNLDYVMAHNPRRLYPLADDKLRTKEIALSAGVAVPELYGVVRTQRDVNRIESLIASRDEFVIKPASGSGGDGILVLGRIGGTLRRPDRSVISGGELIHHVSNIVSGQFSLGGLPDAAMIEYRVRFDPLFEKVAYQGVPDIRIIVYRGYPAMAMVRLPTRQSDGKANLHQGAIGVGIDLKTGVTMDGVSGNHLIREHPDTLNPIAGIEIPNWRGVMRLAAHSYELFGLGYMGVDIVLDRDRGPLILELNVRPGLSIQLANRVGLRKRLSVIEAHGDPAVPVDARLDFPNTHF